MNECEVSVYRDSGIVTMKRKGSSALIEAKILGAETVGEHEFFYLDRVIHKPYEKEVGEFSVKGAVSSVLYHSKMQ